MFTVMIRLFSEPSPNVIVALSGVATVFMSIVGFLMITSITGSGDFLVDLSVGLSLEFIIISMWIVTILVLNVDAKYP